MAERLTPPKNGKDLGANGTQLTANVGARADLIVKAKHKVTTLAKQRNAKQEEVKGLAKEIGDVYRTLKNDLGMSRKDAEFAFKMADLEAEKRNTTFDTIRETFTALGMGEQLSLFTTPETTPTVTH